MPQAASAAGLLEAFKLPLREIRKRFTKSELIIMAWRSQEIASNMRVNQQSHYQNRPKGPVGGSNGAANNYPDLPSNGVPDHDLEIIERRLGETVIAKMVDEDGNIDLRRLTGPEALRYMSAFGIAIPQMGGIVRG